MNFLKKCLSHHWTDWLQKLIPPDQQKNETVWCWYAYAHLRTMENFYAVEAHVFESRRPTWLPQNNSWNIQRNWYFATEMTPSFLVSKVSFTCWKVQNLFVQIWTSITLDPVDRTWLNFQENLYNLSLSWSVKVYQIIFRVDKFIGKTKRVSVQLGHSVVVNCRSHKTTSLWFSALIYVLFLRLLGPNFWSRLVMWHVM